MRRIGSLLCATIAVAMIGIAALAPALAQQAQTPRLMNWHGTLVASVHSVVLGVTTTITDTMVIALEYDPRGNLGRGTLTGSLVGNRSFNKQDHPDCNWAITIPDKLRGKLVGSYTPGAEAMSIQLVEPVVAPAPKKDCPGGGYIYSGDSLHEDADFKRVLGSPRAAADGTFRSSFAQTTGPVTYSLSLTLHPCGSNMPERGNVYVATGQPRKLYSAPSADSSVLTAMVPGQRVRYTQTQQVNGQTWFFVDHFSYKGWAPARDFSCGLPVRPPARPLPQRPEDVGIFEGTAALAAGARG